MELGSDVYVLSLARTLVDTRGTLRSVAAIHGIVQSTVYKYLKRVEFLDHELYIRCRHILYLNKINAHIRGGEANRQRCLKLRLRELQ